MRTEREMLALILQTAERDERIRAVAMNGSRTNPNASKDPFQDFDIVYLVTEIESFIRDRNWVDLFGERIIMQTPESSTLFSPEPGRRFTYLMQFADGNRIDLMLVPLEEKDSYCNEDKLTVILLDKDRCLPAIAAPTDEDYWVKRPSAELFADCCNEFWWVSVYIAKGLWRKEILYAQEHLNRYVRPMLIKMLEWQAGIQTDFSVSTGKCGKYLEKYVSDTTWRKLLSTFADGSYEGAWKALFSMGNLFRNTAKYVADRLNFNYPDEEDERVTAYLRHIQHLSPNATEIY